MATASDTFERKEKKYLITTAQCEAIKKELAGRMRLDDYGATRIDSLYFDTPERSLICRSLEKPLYKEKLRVRSYGAFSEASCVYVEIKKKFKGVVYKRRVRMSAPGAQAYCGRRLSYEQAQAVYPVASNPEEDLKPGKVQIASEIDAFFARHERLVPSMVISCLREAWCPLVGDDADCVDRITFDAEIAYVDLLEDASVRRRRVVSPGQVVMEIKCAGGYPLWLCRLLGAHGVYPRSFSKYGNAYKRVLAEKGAVHVRREGSGKVSVVGVPAAQKHADHGMLLGPSAGFEICEANEADRVSGAFKVPSLP